MLDDADDEVDTRNISTSSSVGLSPSLSNSRSSSYSDVDEVSCGEIQPRPSAASLERIPLQELGPVPPMVTTADSGDNDLQPQTASQPAVLERKEEEQKNDVQVQPTDRVDVVVLQANWHMNKNFKAVLLSIGILCTIAVLLYFGSSLWLRVHRYGILRTDTQSPPAYHAGSPFLSGCYEKACQEYAGALESTVNRSRDPCHDFYQFVCDGWKHQYRSLSILDAAEELMYSRALDTIRRPRLDVDSKELATSAASTVEKKVAGLARSCMHLSESSLEDLKKFLAARHLPWPKTSRWDLLEILLDMSGNWNLHLWFQVTFEMTPEFSGGALEPVLRISPSAAFGAWIAFMRSFLSLPVASTSAVRYRRYIKDMLKFFDVSESSANELATKIEEMNRLTLEALGPAMAEYSVKTLRVPIRNLTDTATPGIITGHLLLILNEYFIWAHRFSAGDIVEVENPGLLRSVIYLRGLKSETREALTLSLGFRVVHELGWMAHRGIADLTLDIMGLPPTAHYRRCLTLIDSTVGIAWHSLFPDQPGAEALVQDVQDILSDTVRRRGKPPLTLQARPRRAQLNDSSLANALREPTPRSRFFVDWMNLMNSRGRLQEQHLLNVLKPGSTLNHQWNFRGTLTVAEDYFVFPLYHRDLPKAVNYGSAGRLVADEVLRGLLHSSPYKPQHSRHGSQLGRYQYSYQSNDSSATEAPQDFQPYSVDRKALLAALSAYRLGIARDPVGFRDSGHAQDRLFFVASCYALCLNKHVVDTLYGDARSRCNQAVKGLPEFLAAFNCEMGHPNS